ncbi:hypothetical protein [Pseudoalteromonas phage PH357]|nr:hypothetical protein [Pseudoalteromonas phage PH357]
MNDYYCSDKVSYPKFRVEYEVDGEPDVSVVSAKSVDLAKRMIYISESAKGNIGVKILKVVML